MAFDVLDEHEQGELVRKWVRENWLSIAIGIGLGLVLLVGWQQWRNHRANHSMEAAVQYEALNADMTKKDYDAVKAIAAKLKSDYADTPYAVFAAMRDALAALGRKDEARTAYAAALLKLDPGAQNRSFVEMKMSDLGAATKAETPAKAEAEKKNS